MRRSTYCVASIVTFFLAYFVSGQNVVFNFSGVLHNKWDISDLLPASITATSTFTGTLSYGPTPDLAPGDPTYGYYIFPPTGGMNMSVTIAGNTIVSLTPTNAPYDVFIVHDELPGVSYDELTFEVVNLRLNGSPLTGVTSANMDIDLQNSGGTGLTTDAMPAYPPTLSQFPSLRRWALWSSIPGGLGYYLEGDITNITAVLPPVLNITRPTGGNTMLSWTGIAGAFLLEQSQTVTGSWTQVPYPRSLEEYKTGMAKFHAAFPDARYTVKEQIAE